MTACLLDTNAFSGLITRDPRLSEATVSFVQGSSRVLLSAVTFYEIGQKVRLGKWPAMEGYVSELDGIAEADGHEIVALTSGLALRASLLDWTHRDPFDRMIAATALRERVPLVSADPAFDAVGVERVWG